MIIRLRRYSASTSVYNFVLQYVYFLYMKYSKQGTSTVIIQYLVLYEYSIFIKGVLVDLVLIHKTARIFIDVLEGILYVLKNCGVRFQYKCPAKTARAQIRIFRNVAITKGSSPVSNYPSNDFEQYDPPRASMQGINSRTQASNGDNFSNETTSGRANASSSASVVRRP